MWSRNPDILWTELSGQAYLMNVENGRYYEVVGVGQAIWHLLDTPLSEDDLVSRVVERYAVSREQCARDVQHFLGKLSAAGLIAHDPVTPSG